MKVFVLSLLWMLCLPVMAQENREAGPGSPDRPNILLMMAEDMSSRVGAFGDPVAVTPNLDALAQQGVRYTNTFTAAGVCAPSRASHILGMHQISTGSQHMRTSTRPEGGYYAVPPAEVKAYPELLRAAGYYTYTDQKLDYQFSSPWPGSGPFTIWDDEGSANADWRGRAEGQPFFGFRNFPVTHESGVFRPLGEMPNSVIHFVMQAMRWWSMDEAVPPVVKPADVPLPPYYPDTPTVRADLARHYDNIAYMDAEVGAILAQLEADGLADSTIVIWTTDHGDGLPRAKRELYDSGLKVPMVIRWPEKYRPADVAPGGIDTRLISFIDFAPTILRLAGVEVPAYLQGQDFAGPQAPAREFIFASRDRIDEVPDRQRAIRDQRFKYIRSWQPEQEQGHPLAYRDNIDMVREMRAMYLAGELNEAQALWFQAPGEEQLYDIGEDPFEINNLAGNPAYTAELIRLRNALGERLAELGDWSEESEAAMVARFEPDGERRVTPVPEAVVSQGLLVISTTEPGSSLGYRLNGGDWKLYTGAVAIGAAETIEAKAVRYGWEESEPVSVSPQT
jgi:N-sulfoglucosamine sulfohydrolase